MSNTKMPEAYLGREQSYIKHTILSSYLTRLFMIIGRKESVINYVDCFSGPWEDETEALRSTSIGISIAQMKLCVESLKNNFGKEIKFRALYIEKNPTAFKRLEKYISNESNADIEVSCLEGDYTELIPDIVNWSNDHFTFFFIDPKGWRKIIGGVTLSPLLSLKNTEFLINLMYDFANRAASIKKHEEDMIELLGEMPKFTGNEDSYQRQQIILSAYRKNINLYYEGRSAYVSIERPGKDRVLYFLIYLTRHPMGIAVFKESAEKMMHVQRVTHMETKLRKQFNASGSMDMFEKEETNFEFDGSNDNRFAAKKYLLECLSKTPTLIDHDCWSKFLEETDLFPTDFQLAIKELLDEGKVENIDADVKRRRSKYIKPNWPGKSERWCLR